MTDSQGALLSMSATLKLIGMFAAVASKGSLLYVKMRYDVQNAHVTGEINPKGGCLQKQAPRCLPYLTLKAAKDQKVAKLAS